MAAQSLQEALINLSDLRLRLKRKDKSTGSVEVVVYQEELGALDIAIKALQWISDLQQDPL